jgi:hypothetical protein
MEPIHINSCCPLPHFRHLVASLNPRERGGFNLDNFPSKINPTSKLVFKHDLLLCNLYFNMLNHFYNYMMLKSLFLFFIFYFFLERENPYMKVKYSKI